MYKKCAKFSETILCFIIIQGKNFFWSGVSEVCKKYYYLTNLYDMIFNKIPQHKNNNNAVAKAFR